MRHFKDYNGREGRFLEGTDFKHIIDLYSFDRDLRDIIFDGIEMIEVAVKSLISDRMSCKHGPHWYLNSSNFTSSYDSAGLESFLKENCNQQSDYHFIRGYMREFTTPEFPPSWMIMELLTFGKISLMFEHLGDPEVRNDICHYFGSAKNLLPSWLHAFTFIRNKCAHHSKLVFTTTPIRPVMPIRQNKRFLNEAEIVDNASLYCILACMQFVISKIDPDARFKERLLNLIAKFPDFDYRQMGFTPEWQKEDLFLISNPSQQYYSPTPGGRELLS
ncbi:Abortive infection bacteriophage resistance protein [Chitinophaga sp. CF118]|nr:Abortive infection bacteriophage resistance protein [Chitinophaga sp. CF118]